MAIWRNLSDLSDYATNTKSLKRRSCDLGTNSDHARFFVGYSL
jgi:hypothetical protein